MSDADLGELQSVVDDLVRAGRFASEAEVLREGVRLLQAREAELKGLDEALARGLADAEAGRGRPADEVFRDLRLKYLQQVAVGK